MKALTAFIAGFIVAIGFSGKATEFFSEIGQCRFNPERSGTFYEGGRKTNNYLTPVCITVGISERFKDSAFGYRVSYLSAGHIEARDNRASIVVEGAPVTATCDQLTGFGCTADYNGNGRTFGFTGSLTYTRRIGPIEVTGEGGLFFFKHCFSASVVRPDIPGWVPGPYKECGELTGPPSPFLGLMLRKGPVYAALRDFYQPLGGRPLSLTDNSFTQVSAGLAWKL